MTPETPDFTYRDVTVFPPYPGETPTDLVGVAGVDELVRVAKLDGRVIGAYRLVQTGETRFAIRAIAVHPDYRRRGIGRWLLGHAMGIAESKGARVIDAPSAAASFLGKFGFRPSGSTLSLSLTPE